jgi:type VI secretion system secreted protein Hcp
MAAVDYFLKFDGIQGESKDSKHGQEIQIDSWSFGGSQTGSFAQGGGGGAGKVHMQDFHFSSRVNKATAKVLEHMSKGKHIASAILTCRKAGGDTPQEFLKVTFTQLLVTSHTMGGSAQSELMPTETISFNFSTYKIEYGEQDEKGNVKAMDQKFGWDLKQMQPA